MKNKIGNILGLGIIFLIADQMVKLILNNRMIINQTIVVVKNFFSITLVHNEGAAFSMLMGSRYLFIFIGIAVIIGLILYIKKMEFIDDFDIFIYALLIGGILGNLIDRIFYGYVIDYLSFNFGNYFFPIFNFADICIVGSIILFLIRMIREDLWK